MKWQPLDRDLSFAGTWNWLPQKDEEELLGPTTFDEAFRELLDQHRRADVNGCWESAAFRPLRMPRIIKQGLVNPGAELPHSAETASAAGSVATTAVGSTSPVHFFIGDHDDGESTSSLMQSHELFETYNIGSDCASLCESSTSLDYNADWHTGSQPDATVSELGEPGAMHSSEEGTCPSPDSASDSMPSSPSSQNWSNDREVSSAVDAKLYQLPAIAVEKHELDHLSRCILEESETWMNWMHHGQGMPSQILWESLLHELCQLGESSRARAYFLAGAELGCRPSCLTRLADLCGDVEPPALLRSASESSVASVESLMSLEPQACEPEAMPQGEQEVPVLRTADRAPDRQVLELDALILPPVPRRVAHGTDFPLPLHSTIRACAGCTQTASRRTSEASRTTATDLDDQERLFQELGRAGYIQKRIHRKLHMQAAQIGDRELLRVGDLCFSKQFAEVERLAGRASTNDCFQ